MVVGCQRWITTLGNRCNVGGLPARRDLHLSQRVVKYEAEHVRF